MLDARTHHDEFILHMVSGGNGDSNSMDDNDSNKAYTVCCRMPIKLNVRRAITLYQIDWSFYCIHSHICQWNIQFRILLRVIYRFVVSV